MTDCEIMRQALDALEDAQKHLVFKYYAEPYTYQKAIDALRQALAQPEQEPAAWNGWVLREVFFNDGYPLSHRKPSKQWVGLTNEEIYECNKLGLRDDVYKAIEAKLREKNT